MARLASLADFEQGGLYTSYTDYPFFLARAQWIAARWSGKILIVGCGWGFLVKHLIDLGIDAWGLDGSSYAVNKAQALFPSSVSSRIMLADATNRSEVAAVKSAAGLSGNRKFDLTVTEDVLPCLTDTEAGLVDDEAQRVSNATLHIITCGSPSDTFRDPTLNWKPLAAWRTFLGTGSTLLDAETWQEG